MGLNRTLPFTKLLLFFLGVYFPRATSEKERPDSENEKDYLFESKNPESNKNMEDGGKYRNFGFILPAFYLMVCFKGLMAEDKKISTSLQHSKTIK